MADNFLLLKNTELNNIGRDYSIIASTNSYILIENANKVIDEYEKIKFLGSFEDYTKYLEIENKERINNFEADFKTKKNFNYITTYTRSDYNIEPNSLIISNLSINPINAYLNSYLVFYNTECGLKQLSYHYKEGNGLYYDADNHVINMNIDNISIKEVNKKLFFDTNSIPITSEDNYGIAYVNNKYLEVNNGILTIKQDYIENVISYKYKIKNLFNNLNTLYNSFSYYNDVYNSKNNTIDEFVEEFGEVVEKNESGEYSRSIKKEISYHYTNSLYFPNSELKYIDNYYFANNMIDEKYKQFIPINENTSYIIYCKDIEKLDIYSYVENEYINYGKVFNINRIRQIESSLDENEKIIDISNISADTDYTYYISNQNRQEILNSNNIYTYIYLDESNNYNKFNVSTNIVNSLLFRYPKTKIQEINQTKAKTFIDSTKNILTYPVFIKRNNGELDCYQEVNINYIQNNDTNYYIPAKDNFEYNYDESGLVCYPATINKIRYNNSFIDSKLFKQLGIILNSKITLPKIKKSIIEYIKNDNAIKYDYTIQNVNCQYESRNIKILYDDRDIAYCTYNPIGVPYDQDVYYFFSDYNINSNITVDKSIAFMLKNVDISFDSNISYLFYGYNYTMKDVNKYNKNYCGIWHDLPTYFVTSNFMNNITSSPTNFVFNNFKELYIENFNELEYNLNNYKAKKLYLYALHDIDEDNHYIEKKSINGNDITINI